MINTLFFVLFLVTSVSFRVHGMHNNTLKEDLELERKLKIINKSPVKSIQTKFGYIIDCINIKEQPAFDHPLLKNHKLQRKPSFEATNGKTSEEISTTKFIIGLEKDTCPKGTVPIRRTTKEDLIRQKYLKDNNNNHILNQDGRDGYVADILTVSAYGPYYGVGGINSIWNTKVGKDQTSESRIWAKNGNGDGINKMLIGWHISPQLYGDDATYLYLAWTSDNFQKTGCYNMQCPGFVQMDSTYTFGGRIENTSTYGSKFVFEIPASIFQDPESKHWWVTVSGKNIGYFPRGLFNNMNSADQVGWGGRTTTPTGAPNPPMGSGYFPDDNYLHVAYFRQITVRNESRQDHGLYIAEEDDTVDKPNCYEVRFGDNISDFFGNAVQFGGPGGVC